MTKIAVILSCLCFLNLVLQGQNQSSENSKPLFSLSSGNALLVLPWQNQSTNLSIDDMRLLAPESEIFQRDFSGYETSSNLYFARGRSVLGVPATVLINFDVNSKNEFIQKFRPEFRVGLSYWRNQIARSTYKHEERFPAGTVNTGEPQG